MTNAEAETIENCLRNLNTLEGCQAEFVPAEPPANHAGEVSLRGHWGTQHYQAMTFLRLSAGSAEVAIHRLKSHTGNQPLLLFSDFLSEEVGGRLRESGIDFVDSAGNAHLVNPPLYLEISGRKRHHRPPRSGRLFQSTGLKLLYLLLCQPQSTRWTYRDLAQNAGIALGAVGTILQELINLGHLDLDTPSGKQLLALNELLTRWQIGYGEKLRPKLYLKRCRLGNSSSLEDLCQLICRNNLGDKVLIGGELGARLLLQLPPGETTTLHLTGGPLRTMLQLHLIPDEQGPITLLSQFGNTNRWQGWQPEGCNLADPLLLHAEMLTGREYDEVLIGKLYKRYIEPRLAGEHPE
ncbi:MAG TPA: type IV toxin-antitoxin system AbiEi family antitoxin [Geothermobacteraceae bacterium]|nr:type IV toxin-antitoxin system AbiEi family antitoxin [Geothermobacteraceae bacterium]